MDHGMVVGREKLSPASCRLKAIVRMRPRFLVMVQERSVPVWEQLSPEPNQVNVDKVDLKEFHSLAIPKTFIHCRHDKSLGPGYFHPRMSSRLGNFKLLELDGSHEVLFTRPRELAEKLVEASSG
jgi:hypothetical protein